MKKSRWIFLCVALFVIVASVHGKNCFHNSVIWIYISIYRYIDTLILRWSYISIYRFRDISEAIYRYIDSKVSIYRYIATLSKNLCTGFPLERHI